ncbi:aquaporin-5-like [Leucoraja erinacea]|uniref:aquaporin-5-like n=1 Tax=Leucoraja erinaceus TaxID=7782 RepID=UPI002453D93F|nr:aquaporin-5-like [Leucoraja erinacea]
MEQLKRELRTETLWRALPAEFLGTAVLVFCGVASALAWAGQQPPVLQVALGFGLAVSAASLFTQGVGAGHLNPAVSLALLVSLRISPLRALLSALMQSLGSIAACALLQALTPLHVRGEMGLSKPSAGVTQIQALVVEVIVTFQLVLCVFVISQKESHFEGSAQVALGVSVTLGHLVAIRFTGCSMNPARSLGPAVITSNFSQHWIFWVGPLLGGVLAAIVYSSLLTPKRFRCGDCLSMWKTDAEPEHKVEARP